MNNYSIQKSSGQVASSILLKYQQALRSLPVPNGNGCHQAILGVSNYGVFAKLTSSQIYDDIRSRLSELGGRKVPDREINAAIQRAFNDADKDWKPSPPRRQINAPKTRAVLAQRTDIDEAKLRGMSPIKLNDDPSRDMLLVLQTLYEPTNMLYIGGSESPGIIGQTIRSASDWIKYFEDGGKSFPHIIPNPLTGKLGKLKSGDGETFRGDDCIAKFKFIIAEFDGIPREEQITFWVNSGFPLYCLIDSGGKSIHGWIRVDGIQDAKRWESVVRNRFFPERLVPMGVDSACKNESRLSRLPGHFRADKGNFQRLLWLSKEGQEL